jgi:hypothetical protein
MELQMAKGWRGLILAFAGDKQRRQDLVCKGPGDLNVNFLFTRDLCVNVLVEVEQLSFQKVPVYNFQFNKGMLAKKTLLKYSLRFGK